MNLIDCCCCSVGSIYCNRCSQNTYGECKEGETGACTKHSHEPSCGVQLFPDEAFKTTPLQAPLRGPLGLSLYGVNVYGLFEAGFTEGQVCDKGSCDAGVDVQNCDAQMRYQCEDLDPANFAAGMLLDTCVSTNNIVSTMTSVQLCPVLFKNTRMNHLM